METRNKKRKLIDLSDIENNKEVIQKNTIKNIQIKVERILPHNQYDMSSEFNDNFFDEASNAWRENKIKIKNGEFRYKYPYID
jgi:hypothetical protein